MSVILTTHPSFRECLVAECDAPNEEMARKLVEARARQAGCEIVPDSYAGPRPYAQVHVWLLAPRYSLTGRQELAQAA